MEPITQLPGTIKGTEVLYFSEAEVSKCKGNDSSFASFGSLSVLYFKDYNRFVLQLNDWRYPILRRLNIQSTGNGSYVLPGANGFSYILSVSNPSGQSLQSLNSLLEGTRKLETSPEDKLVRKPLPNAETGVKEVIGNTIKQVVHKVQTKVATMKTGTKYLTSTKKRIDTKSLKNRNFKKTAHSSFKKDFFQSSEKLSSEFLKRRSDNLGADARDLEGLRKFSNGPMMYLPREEIEEAILGGKEIFTNSSPMEPTVSKPESKGLIASLKEGVQGLKDNLRGESRNAGAQVQSEKMPVSVEHYQG